LPRLFRYFAVNWFEHFETFVRLVGLTLKNKSRRYALTFLNESHRVAAKVIGHAFLLFSFEYQVPLAPYAYSCRLNRLLIAALGQRASREMVLGLSVGSKMERI